MFTEPWLTDRKNPNSFIYLFAFHECHNFMNEGVWGPLNIRFDPYKLYFGDNCNIIVAL